MSATLPCRLELETCGTGTVPDEPVRTFVMRVASHRRSIMKAKVDDKTRVEADEVLAIATFAMRRYRIPTLDIPRITTLGELVSLLEKANRVRPADV